MLFLLLKIYSILLIHFNRNFAVYGSLGATLMALGLFLYLSHLQTSESTQLGRSAPGQIIANSRIIRMATFLISNTLIAICAVFSVVSLSHNMTKNISNKKFKYFSFILQINFEEIIVMPSFNVSSLNSSEFGMNLVGNVTDELNITEIDVQYSQPIETAPVYLFCCALSLAAISAFLRAGFVLKFLCMICSIVVQGCVLSLSKLYAFYNHEADKARCVWLPLYFSPF